jgi:hypothetical protein
MIESFVVSTSEVADKEADDSIGKTYDITEYTEDSNSTGDA